MRLLIWILLVLASTAQANQANQPHTWHNVTSNASAECQFAQVNQRGFYLVDQNLNVVWKFALQPNLVYIYGFVITNSTFDLLYSLTCVSQSYNTSSQTPKICFVIGADGPAQPNIQTLNYYGAQGYWKTITDVGENFYLYFK